MRKARGKIQYVRSVIFAQSSTGARASTRPDRSRRRQESRESDVRLSSVGDWGLPRGARPGALPAPREASVVRCQKQPGGSPCGVGVVTSRGEPASLQDPCQRLLEGAQDLAPGPLRAKLLPNPGLGAARCLRQTAAAGCTPAAGSHVSVALPAYTSACRPRTNHVQRQLQSFFDPPLPRHPEFATETSLPTGVADEVAVLVLLGAVVGAMLIADQPPLAQRLPARQPASSTVRYSRRCAVSMPLPVFNMCYRGRFRLRRRRAGSRSSSG